MNLFFALGYKEWTKTKKILFLSLLSVLLIVAYSFVEINNEIKTHGLNNIWYLYIFQNKTINILLKWILPVVSLCMALFQFIPEMVNKRLKLTLHLPLSEIKVVSYMLLYGTIVIFIISSILLSLSIIGMSFYLPKELLYNIIVQFIPSIITTFIVYYYTAWICMEQNWIRRVINMVLAISGIYMLNISSVPYAYQNSFIIFVILLFTAIFLPIHSCIRFKNGIQ